MQTINIKTNWRAYCIMLAIGVLLGGGAFWYFFARPNESRANSDIRQIRSELNAERELAKRFKGEFERERASVQRLEDLQRSSNDRIKFLERKDQEQRRIVERIQGTDNKDRELIKRGRELAKKL